MSDGLARLHGDLHACPHQELVRDEWLTSDVVS